MKTRMLVVSFASLLLAVGCGDGDDLDSDAEARWSYLGFDAAVDKAINLGFDGFNAATNANIPPQNGTGDVSGTMVISGQVDQGASNNKEMRLDVALTAYTDPSFDDPNTEDTTEDLSITYDTDPLALPRLTLSLKDIPNGTLTGSLNGTFTVTGSVDATATFALILAADIEEGATAGQVVRKAGTLSITGTVTSGDGTYDVNVMR